MHSPADFAPDPENAADVLAFVLCPASAFAPQADDEEVEAVRQVMLPVKTEAVRRWAMAKRAHNWS
jgi:hypothetical protein